MTEIRRIDRLGRRGDGIVEAGAEPLYVPLTLPGETVEIAGAGARRAVQRIVEPSQARIAPCCAHFGTCGGCALQHLRQSDYLAWKREQVRTALAQRGLDCEVEPVISVPPGSRRRTVLAARRTGQGVVLGYHERMSDRIVPVSACPVLVPEIEEALPVLARWLAPLLPRKGEARITVTATDTGLDVAMDGAGSPAPGQVAGVLARCPVTLNLARLSIGGEPVLIQAEPVIEVGGVPVILPPGAFIQAAGQAEAAMAELVGEGVGQARRIADLYCGIGTFALRLARSASVLAVESEASALAALEEAARRAQGLKPIETLRRDLERHPISASELNRFDAVIFDPPRAGAKAQAGEIARSKLARVVAVSCNPATLARDLRILVDGGYEVRRVVPVDQFLFSHHVEVVALLERG